MIFFIYEIPEPTICFPASFSSQTSEVFYPPNPSTLPSRPTPAPPTTTADPSTIPPLTTCVSPVEILQMVNILSNQGWDAQAYREAGGTGGSSFWNHRAPCPRSRGDAHHPYQRTEDDPCHHHGQRNCRQCKANLPLHVRVNQIYSTIAKLIEEIDGRILENSQVRDMIANFRGWYALFCLF